jgi:hypothetical protein
MSNISPKFPKIPFPLYSSSIIATVMHYIVPCMMLLTLALKVLTPSHFSCLRLASHATMLVRHQQLGVDTQAVAPFMHTSNYRRDHCPHEVWHGRRAGRAGPQARSSMHGVALGWRQCHLLPLFQIISHFSFFLSLYLTVTTNLSLTITKAEFPSIKKRFWENNERIQL